MPLKLNVGLSKKMGLPRYGSLGAACHVEVELESSLLSNDPERFQEHVRRAYVACAQAVNEELARHRGESSVPGNEPDHVSTDAANGRRNGQNGASAVHSVTQKQIEYAAQLALQIGGLEAPALETFVSRVFSKPVADLTTVEASSLIDTLKAIKAGQIDLRTLFAETAE